LVGESFGSMVSGLSGVGGASTDLHMWHAESSTA
jgi:hypothetical protein